ncbi:MAG: preprotein translocase subunit SecA [Bdellovibrionota bacterium]|nr:preprotein translocase subunit SecA [Bdellovibrionota bacterium]
MIDSLLAKVFGTHHDRQMKRLQPMVDAINALEDSIKKLSDDELKNKTEEFKTRLQNGETTDDILSEAFAVCREAAWRVLGMRHYDVQLIGGMVLHSGSIAEMRTGEGKTLVATLPVYLNALTGKGVHVVTVNDYLAKRDCEWMGRLYNWLGLTTGIITHELNDFERKQAYGADITYATNNELGFDYLRDNMKYSLSNYVQRPHHYAIVDECDSILIDEARTPLIISGPSEESTEKYTKVNAIIPHLEVEKHFTIEEKSKSAMLTDDGNSKVEELLGINNIYDPQHIDMLHGVYQGLKAYHLFKKDVDYMIKNGEIVIVDEFTGRLMEGRRWSDGLHQAIEAKEGLNVKSENQTLASVTFQNYFRMYEKLSGMTGTADTEAVEFKKIYNLDVTVIPTNKPIARKDLNDVIYKTEVAKFNAIVDDIKERAKNGQPVLVGTVSIERSERISHHLNKSGVKHHVLNAKHHEKEADIVAQAGRLGAITIATNMAGRGTDIVLGGNAEALAREINPDESSEEFQQALKKFEAQCKEEKQKVLGAGGLYIIGTERHESRRIDNQLRGRAGRQGDPGGSRFYLSLEDDLLRIFNGEKIQQIMTRLNVPDDEPIEAGMVSRSIENAQKKVEGQNFDIRKHLLEYDDVMNQQRNAVYDLRKEVLAGDNIDGVVKEMMGEVVSNILDIYAPADGKAHLADLDGLNSHLNKIFGAQIADIKKLSADEIIPAVQAAVQARYDHQSKMLGHLFDDVKQKILLQAIDNKWKDHLLSMDHLKDGINLRSFAQKDPLIEYKKEAFSMFTNFHYTVREEALELIFKIQLGLQDEHGNMIPVSEIDPALLNDEFGMDEELDEDSFEMSRPEMMSTSGPEPSSGNETFSFSNRREPEAEEKPETFIREEAKVGRNDPCPCGSGKKFKQCHGKN